MTPIIRSLMPEDAPEAARCGVGTLIVRALEDLARDHGLTALHLDPSLTAAAFYSSLGYESRGRATHTLRRRSGDRPMACVKMEKAV